MIYLFNHCHNGDIHFSREFARDCKQQLADVAYLHHCSNDILHDLDIKQIPLSTKPELDLHRPIIQHGDDLYINTWIGTGGRSFMGYCDLNTNYAFWHKLVQMANLNIKMRSKIAYIPQIDFSRFEIDNINKYRFDTWRKCVLICNNDCCSDQAVNIDWTPLISKLATMFKSTAFFVTNNNKVLSDNVIDVSHLVGKTGCNLMEIAYLATKCNIIVGKGSGPFCVASNTTTLLDAAKTFIVCGKVIKDVAWYIDRPGGMLHAGDGGDLAKIFGCILGVL